MQTGYSKRIYLYLYDGPKSTGCASDNPVVCACFFFLLGQDLKYESTMLFWKVFFFVLFLKTSPQSLRFQAIVLQPLYFLLVFFCFFFKDAFPVSSGDGLVSVESFNRKCHHVLHLHSRRVRGLSVLGNWYGGKLDTVQKKRKKKPSVFLFFYSFRDLFYANSTNRYGLLLK